MATISFTPPSKSSSPLRTNSTAATARGSTSTAIFTASGKAPISTMAKAATMTSIRRSEEHTSELQSLMRISYAVFCLKKKTKTTNIKKKAKQHNQEYNTK